MSYGYGRYPGEDDLEERGQEGYDQGVKESEKEIARLKAEISNLRERVAHLEDGLRISKTN